QEAEHCLAQIEEGAELLVNEALMEEVTALVEWPTVLLGQFAKDFLLLPPEILISTMQDHQRYFPVVNAQGNLLPYFMIVCNIASPVPQRVIHGNERVLRARLADATFFYATDKKEALETRVEHLKGIVFQEKLGNLFEKVQRITALAGFLAHLMGVD